MDATYKVNEKFESVLYNFNKRNFTNLLIISSLCSFIYGILLLKSGDLLLASFIFSCCLSNLFLANYVDKLNSNEILFIIHNLVFCGATFFFPTYLILGYYYGLKFQHTQKMFYVVFGFMKILFSIRLFKRKTFSYIFASLYSFNICFLVYLYYFLYGYEQFASYFNSIDVLYAIFSILIIIYSITFTRHTFYDEFNKVIWETEFFTEKFNGLFKHSITPIIKIDKENYNIDFNDSIKVFLEKIIYNQEDLHGFLEISDNAMDQFKNETKLSKEYKQFHQTLSFKNESSFSTRCRVSNTSIKSLNLFEINDLKIDIFYKRIYYLDKIIKNFKSNQIKSSTLVNDKKKNFIKSNLFDILFSNYSNISEDDEKYKKIGNFYVNPTNNLSTKTTFDMLFRRSEVFGVEFLDILFYDTSAVTQIEKEKANAEVESRKQYLSIVSDKFMTPVQVLLLCIKDIDKQIKNKQKIHPTSLAQIKSLGALIQIMNQDITFMSRVESGIDINFKNFKTNKLFNMSKEIIDLLIKNNPTKCYAIKTKLVISPEVPSVLNSDINRLKQVLVNFLSNAYKFTLTGEIKITVKVKESTSFYDEIVVSINDTGIGVRDDYKETLFSQIEEIKDLKNLQITGSDFGLIMSNTIISRLGTNIEYEPKKSGSIFSFSFYNIKSEDIEYIIKKDKFQKMKDLIKIKILHSSTRKVTTKIDSISDLENDLKRTKHCLSSQNLSLKSVNKEQVETINLLNCSSSSSKNDICELKKLSIEENTDINNNKNNDAIKVSKKHIVDYENNEIFDVDHCKNLKYDWDKDKDFKISSLNIRRISNPILPFDKSNSDKFFNFDDSVFDAYKINIDDSIYLDKSMEIDTSLVSKLLFDPSTNKYSTLFNEISEICKKYHENLEFLKIYENFKPYIKFFYNTLKKADFDINPSVNKICNFKRILIVDDNKPILKALKNLIKIAIKDLKVTDKVEILKAYDGVDALALFKIDHYTSQSISYIISDHNMSMMDGRDFINLVNNYKLGRDIKLYISSTDNEIIKANKLKNVEFLNKPVRKSDLKNLLSNIIV